MDRYILARCLCLPVAAIFAACDSGDGSGRPAPPTLPAAVTTAGAGATTILDGERFVAVRTLPVAALSSEDLAPAGTARDDAGDEIAMARANAAAGAEPWELISAADEGWRVWRPASVLDAIDAAAGAELRSAEAVDWPDSCLGLDFDGQVCLASITHGYRVVVVDAGGEMITYRTSATGRVEREP